MRALANEKPTTPTVIRFHPTDRDSVSDQLLNLCGWFRRPACKYILKANSAYQPNALRVLNVVVVFVVVNAHRLFVDYCFVRCVDD